jgi:hypothetical protein
MSDNRSGHARKVVRSLEAWEPILSTTVVLNPGAVLENLHIVFDRRVGPAQSSVRWALEFRAGGVLYRADFDRVMQSTAPIESAMGAQS